MPAPAKLKGLKYKPSFIQTLYASLQGILATDPALAYLLKNPIWTFGSRSALYNAMEADPIINAGLTKRAGAEQGDSWYVETDSDDERDKVRAQELEQALRTPSLGFERARRRMAWRGIGRGMATVELDWTPVVGGYNVPAFKPFPEGWITFVSETDEPRIATKAGIGTVEDTAPIPPGKMILHRVNYEEFENPYGSGVLLKTYWPYIFTLIIMQAMGQTARIFPYPLLVGKYPMNKPQLKDKLEEVFKKLKYEYFITAPVDPNSPIGNVVEPVYQHSREAVNIYEKFYDMLRDQKLIAIMGQTLSTVIGKTGGAYAASVTQQNEYIRQIVMPGARASDATLNNQLMPYINEYNFGDPDAPFRIRTVVKMEKDRMGLSKMFGDFASVSDMIPLRDAHEEMEIRVAEEDELVLKKKSMPSPFASPVEETEETVIEEREAWW